MNKTKIEWCDYTINPVKGLCPVACPYCYARAMYKRFHLHKDGTPNPVWNPEIRMEPDWREDLPKKPSRVFIGSTMELFGDWVEEWMWDSIWEYVNDYPQHTFIFLTKRPENLIKFSPFPKNCWVGVSETECYPKNTPLYYLEKVEAKVKFISFEPLLKWPDERTRSYESILKADISWVIIGQKTPVSKKTMPKVEWIQDIVQAADTAGIPVFLKNNLDGVLHHRWQDNVYGKLFRNENETLRQEFPGVKEGDIFVNENSN